MLYLVFAEFDEYMRPDILSYHYTEEEADDAVKMLELERDFKNEIASLRLEPQLKDRREFSVECVYDTGVPQDEFDIKERYADEMAKAVRWRRDHDEEHDELAKEQQRLQKEKNREDVLEFMAWWNKNSNDEERWEKLRAHENVFAFYMTYNGTDDIVRWYRDVQAQEPFDPEQPPFVQPAMNFPF